MRVVVILIAVGAITSCATSRYGREQRLIPEERAAYDCAAVALEIAKCDAFTKNVYAQWSDTKGRRFLGFLMDVGIGDRREKSDALDSAAERREQLAELAKAKNCPAPPPAPEDD